MVRLDRIVTRTGDDGTTALGDGRRVAKDHPLIIAMGTVDEANCALGVVRAETLPPGLAEAIAAAQNDLFDVGADLCLPAGSPGLRVGDAHLARLDAAIADATARLPALTSFILPGGTRTAALLHVARTVVRRAERDVVTAIAHGDPAVSEACRRYLNRLSDACFVWARRCNDEGRADVLWVPGKGAGA